ncbi:uncharacterized protein (DUF2147 family) [Flavobacterium arsenatis]|uniref:Uncharacterized protein (DUF2147 family) n=1 Tax=Flavobacterium arsenatis TaxID=1484332 RepID=A0ABU1TPH2_9FLAO|nr:DUF2147 domain-containing protein [Flavobacterium arsenatis]MDR6967829.1 uncharacterized protein (DUF2147 family) [Flavobacterium arsenatis]
MKKLLYISLMLVFSIVQTSQSQSVVGKWKTIDDESGEAKSVVEIYEQDGKVYGKVITIFDKTKEKNLCDKCEGDKKNKPVKGMVILEGAKKNGSSWEGGTILDPTKGKVYKCTLSLENKDKLKLRGYVGISLLGRTQYWERVK